MKNERLQAKHVPELAILHALSVEVGKWWTTGDGYSMPSLSALAGFNQFPWKVLNAKLDRMEKRGLIDGCSCGCRGDWYILPAGQKKLDESGYAGDGSAMAELNRAKEHTESWQREMKRRALAEPSPVAQAVYDSVVYGTGLVVLAQPSLLLRVKL